MCMMGYTSTLSKISDPSSGVVSLASSVIGASISSLRRSSSSIERLPKSVSNGGTHPGHVETRVRPSASRLLTGSAPHQISCSQRQTAPNSHAERCPKNARLGATSQDIQRSVFICAGAYDRQQDNPRGSNRTSRHSNRFMNAWSEVSQSCVDAVTRT